MKKIVFMLVAVGLFVLVLAGCSDSSAGGSNSSDSDGGQEASGKVWKLGHIRPEGTQTDEDVQWFTDQVIEQTNGSLSFETYPASQLGDYTVLQERISMGDIEMQLAPLGTSVDERLGIVSLPYLVTNWEDAYQAYGPDSEMTKIVDELLAEQNIKVLGMYPKYFGGVALKERPENPTELGSKGMKIRVPNIKAYELTANELGYTSTPLPFSEAFTSVQTGVVDGLIGSGAEGYYDSFRDVVNYYLPINDHFEMWYLYVSSSAWESLTEEEQTVLSDVANKFTERRFDAAAEETEEYEQLLAEEGIEIIDFSDKDLESIKEQIHEKVWPKLESEYTKELMDRIKKDVGIE